MCAIKMRYDLDITFGHDEGSEGSHLHAMKSCRFGGSLWAVLISPEENVLCNDFSISPESAIAYFEKRT